MTDRRDVPDMSNESDEPREYRYRYKYLRKYQDAPPESEESKDEEETQDGQRQEESRDSLGDREDKQDKGGDKKKPSPGERRKQKRKRIIVLSIIAAVFILAALIWLLLYIFVFSQRETTDDAYVRGDMVTISSRIPGTVVEIAVEETERVHAGQVLLRLDPADARVSLMNAEGQLAQAVREAQQRIQQAAQADAAVTQRRAQYETERDNYRRRHPLVEQHAVAPEEAETTERQMQAAGAALEQAQREAAAAHAQVDGTDVHDFPAVIQARAQFRNAWINNNRNAIVSPIDGYAARRQVQVGQRVQPGQDLLTVVPLSDLWVDANFKETQLQNLRIGQPVEITTDIYSGVIYHGRVVGLNAGTGSAFSLLPAENATGNWIKVVQRLPVRIGLDPRELTRHPLRIGLSTYVNADTHNRDGLVLSERIRNHPLASTAVYEREVNEADRRAEAIIARNTVSLPAIVRADGKPQRSH
ncbi:MAG TPA: efflux RND transporter periplasmic adaptor subunit [Dyella sp.]|uniref:efflux RND transporter periplasmic adaptor subunit n=1 Tax=Dyella sp. TaxID=1869338 RepID=UPI002F933552